LKTSGRRGGRKGHWLFIQPNLDGRQVKVPLPTIHWQENHRTQHRRAKHIREKPIKQFLIAGKGHAPKLGREVIKIDVGGVEVKGVLKNNDASIGVAVKTPALFSVTSCQGRFGGRTGSRRDVSVGKRANLKTQTNPKSMLTTLE